ncbi:hypothetical protein F5B22DRAFT_630120 [Xylaria bambusicola]|uniref:uncharacterized protein n=1 Tax=Xylaria bambusicola TaxID=326684 RepID=UPI002007280F|nr:uncharacterized protein F5B22DRAFT_630120 [Xylaria bambusicola]KAI0503211.1 hypothetical protein F5B22DRAFT_630120 [Xylaria bambusicola]
MIVSSPALASMAEVWKDRFLQGGLSWYAWHHGLLDDVYDRINCAPINLFSAARRLRSFACSQLALSRECIGTLSSLTDLRSLYYDFPVGHKLNMRCEMGEIRLNGGLYTACAGTYGAPPQDAICKHLTQLSLINICGDLDVWKRWVICVISESAQLKRLSVSIEYDMILNLDPPEGRGNSIEHPFNLVQYINEMPVPDAICATTLREVYMAGIIDFTDDPHFWIGTLDLKAWASLSHFAFLIIEPDSIESISQKASHTLTSLSVERIFFHNVVDPPPSLPEIFRRLDNRRIT